MEKIVEFVIPLGPNDRRRHKHTSLKGKILGFSVQYETKIKDIWYAVVRYDTAHNFVHQDIMHLNKSPEKIILAFGNFNEALTFADNDIKLNWEKYKKAFLTEVNG